MFPQRSGEPSELRAGAFFERKQITMRFFGAPGYTPYSQRHFKARLTKQDLKSLSRSTCIIFKLNLRV